MLVPTPAAVLIISLLILTLTLYNLKITLGCYTFLTESYDLVSRSLVILTIWLIILIIIAQKSVEYKKILMASIVVLLLRLVLTFSTIRIIIFYFFFEWSLIPIFFIIIG